MNIVTCWSLGILICVRRTETRRATCIISDEDERIFSKNAHTPEKVSGIAYMTGVLWSSYIRTYAEAFIGMCVSTHADWISLYRLRVRIRKTLRDFSFDILMV